MAQATGSRRQFLDSAFIDEGAGAHKADLKPFEMQCAISMACGLQLVDLRFASFGGGPNTNIMKWNPAEIQAAKQQLAEYGLKVSCIGSPIGKRGIPATQADFNTYLDTDVQTACDRADAFDTALVRIFGFYAWLNDKSEIVTAGQRAERFKQALEYCASMGEAARKRGKVFCVELEAGLFGCNGQEIAQICQHANNPHLCGLFDAANSFVQVQSTDGVIADWRAMRNVQGPVIHWKDFLRPAGWKWDGNEEALRHFVPVNIGECGHNIIMAEFADLGPDLTAKYGSYGIDQLRGTAEPHVKGGGQFGGYSGADGLRVALDAIRRMKFNLGIGGSDFVSWGQIEAWKNTNFHLQ